MFFEERQDASHFHGGVEGGRDGKLSAPSLVAPMRDDLASGVARAAMPEVARESENTVAGVGLRRRSR